MQQSGKLRKALRLWPLVLVGLCGCNGQDADRLSRVWKKSAEKAEGLTGKWRNTLAFGWLSLRGNQPLALSLQDRVIARLRWDRELAGSYIQIQASEDVVELKGEVLTLDQRRRAVDLAQSTTGVDRVIDQLEVRPPR